MAAARSINKLTEARIRKAKPGTSIRKLSDGGGLQLWLMPNGSKLWRLAYRFLGKQKLLSFGGYPVLGLADARQKRDEAKRLLADGVDPSEAKRAARVEAQAAAITFGSVADEYVAKLEREGRAEVTLSKLRWLLSLASKDIGHRRISEIKPADVLVPLRRAEQRGRYETARRMRSTIGSVFRYAVATARAEQDPAEALKGALTAPRVAHQSAVTDSVAFGALLRAIDTFDGQPNTAIALKLMALLFPRPGELRQAEWSEFDLERGTWVIPEARAKMRRPHKKPLSRQAVELLNKLHSLTGDGSLAFPSIRSWQRPMSENTLNAALRRLGYGKDEMTSHGFRASASTLLNESGKWNADAIERELAHIEGNSVRKAYARGEHFDERCEMIQWWADYCDQLKRGGEVLQLRTPNQSAV